MTTDLIRFIVTGDGANRTAFDLHSFLWVTVVEYLPDALICTCAARDWKYIEPLADRTGVTLQQEKTDANI